MANKITAFTFAASIGTLAGDDTLVASVPATGCDKLGLIELLAKQLHFPEWHGHNWNALYDCLCDFSWTDKRRILIWHEGLPNGLDERSLRSYLDVLSDAVLGWKPHEKHELKVFFPSECRKTIEKVLGAS